MKTHEISNCCNAPMSVQGNTTKHFECQECKKPCDIGETLIDQMQAEAREEFRERFTTKYSDDFNRLKEVREQEPLEFVDTLITSTITTTVQKILDSEEMREETIVCPECNGDGWVSGSEASHGCDGTDEVCQQMCPIQVQTQEGCEFCRAEGNIEKESEHNAAIRAVREYLLTLVK